MISRWTAGLLLAFALCSMASARPVTLRPPVDSEGGSESRPRAESQLRAESQPKAESQSERPIAIAMGMTEDSPIAQPDPMARDLPGPGDALPIALSLLDFTIPPGLNGQTPVGASAIHMPRQRVDNRRAFLSSQRQEASAAFPILIDAPDTLIGTLEVRNTQFQTNAFLTSSRREFPKELWEIQPGLAYLRDLGDGWLLGGNLAIASASDRPFHSSREIAPAFGAFLRVPAKDDDSWLYSLTYNPVSAVRFPIPGLAYEYNPSPQLQLSIGLPFSVVWKPTESLRFDFAYIPPLSVRTQLTWQPMSAVGVFAGFEWVNDSYLLANRPSRRDFFYVYEKRFPVGIRFNIADRFTLDVGGGYAFDRLFFTAKQFNERSRDRIEVRPTTYLMLRFAVQL